MFHWLRKQKEPQVRLKEVEIGDGNITVDIPFHFIVEQEDDATTIVYDPKIDDVGARLSTIYITNSQNDDEQNLGARKVRIWAKEHRLRVIQHGDIIYAAHHEAAQEEGEDGDRYLWLASLNNCIVYISSWISRSCEDDPKIKAFLDTIEPAIRSIRESRFQKYKLEEEQKQDVQPLSQEHAELINHLLQSAIDSARTLLGKASFTGGDSDCSVIQTLLDHPNFDKSQEAVIKGLGVIFGGILARKLDLHWVSVTDEYGSTPALQHAKHSFVLYPIDMLIKRVERGEKIDVMYLINSFCEEVPKMMASDEPGES